MWRALPLLLLLGACSTLQPGLDDSNARQFYSVPGKSVIYLVREKPDPHPHPTVVTLNNSVESLTYPGTFVRWEVTPGMHRIAGYAGDGGAIALTTESGKIYFIRQTVKPVHNLLQSKFDTIKEQDGREAVTRSARIAS